MTRCWLWMGFLNSLWRSIGGCLKRIEYTDINYKYKVLVVDQNLAAKLRLVFRNLVMALTGNTNMLHPSLQPPESVQGMTTLTREKFNKTVQVPGIKMPKKQICSTQKNWKSLLLKLRGIKAIACLDENDPLKDSHNLILLDPAQLDTDSEVHDKLEKMGFFSMDLEKYELNIGYNNWSVSDIMKAILPQDADNVTSFTQIGHIAHLNLKEGNLPYKHIIGEVIVDKIPSVKTVVNKLNSIDNTYRNFEMELLAGERNYVTQTKEHGCIFELDFSKVYWNSRLSTEHNRIVDNVQKGSIVYDVFGGVGPFTIPLAKKRTCTIFANDLNPCSFKYLKRNIELNKLNHDSIKSFNMDGRDFIKNVVKHDLSQRIEFAHSNHHTYAGDQSGDNVTSKKELKTLDSEKEEICPPTVVVMNLPALAIDFLDAFVSLLSDLPIKFYDTKLIDQILPTIYCYAFSEKKDDIETEVKERAKIVLNQNLPSDATVRIVRNVSPNKEMVCLTFKLWAGLVLAADCKHSAEDDQHCAEPKSKKIKSSV